MASELVEDEALPVTKLGMTSSCLGVFEIAASVAEVE